MRGWGLVCFINYFAVYCILSCINLVLDIDRDYCLMAFCEQLTSLVLPGDSTAGSTRSVLEWLLRSIYRLHVVCCQLLTEQRTSFFTEYM